MNQLLAKHKPEDITQEKWEELWANSHYVLQPLADALKELVKDAESVKNTDFDTPNHYAKLVHKLTEKALVNKILGMLPDSVEK